VSAPRTIAAVLIEKRAQHPELRRPLTWAVARRVCAREGLTVRQGRLSTDGCLIAAWDVILLSNRLDARGRADIVAKALGRWWLRVSDDLRDWRQDEADFLATALLRGW
jgi:hypothetical protein